MKSKYDIGNYWINYEGRVNAKGKEWLSLSEEEKGRRIRDGLLKQKAHQKKLKEARIARGAKR